MDPTGLPPHTSSLLDERAAFDLAALCQACDAAADELLALVDEGVLQPTGPTPQEWHFAVSDLPRARRALRLQHEFEIDATAVALVIELLDRIDALESRLRRLGAR